MGEQAPSAKSDRDPPNATDAGALAAEVARVCAAPRFEKAPLLRQLLLYLESKGTAAGEYAVGVDVLGRKPDFDPKTDATVRVHMGRLRQRLKDYYDNEGSGAAVYLAIPPGSYRLALEPAAPGSNAPIKRAVLRPSVLRAALAILLALSAGLAWDNWRLRQPPATPPPARPLHPFWTPLLGDSSPVNMVVPAPLFFLWPNLVVRDFTVNDESQFASSAALRELRDKLGAPESSQLYTLASDTLAAGAVSRYLADRGIAATMLDSPTVSIETLGSRNAILFVGPGSMNQASDLLGGMNFYLKTGTLSVLNRKPLPGEPALWKEIQHAPLRTTSYGIVARLPGRDPGKHVLVVASRFNVGISSFLTSSPELDGLERLRRASGAPEYFEAVIEFDRNNEKILRAKPIAIRSVGR